MPASASASASASGAAATGPVVAPYVDILGSTANISDIHQKTGQADFAVAFVLAASSGSCTPTWGGSVALGNAKVRASLDKIDALGGDVIVATGGATGTYLESVCSPAQLASAYAKVLDAAGSNHLDVDLEKPVDPAVVTAALATLQQARRTAITFTVPVGSRSAGLTSASIALLTSAKKAGLTVTVNAMTMNFDASGDWGTAMTAATEAVHADLAAIWTGKSSATLYAMLGVTPMIGVNDTGPVTSLADARTLLGYAADRGLGFVRFWSVNRDNGGCSGGALSSTCSGISQTAYAFTKLFAGYAR